MVTMSSAARTEHPVGRRGRDRRQNANGTPRLESDCGYWNGGPADRVRPGQRFAGGFPSAASACEATGGPGRRSPGIAPSVMAGARVLIFSGYRPQHPTWVGESLVPDTAVRRTHLSLRRNRTAMLRQMSALWSNGYDFGL